MRNEPSPRGNIAIPACTAGYPSSVCRNIGSITRLPYSTKPTIVISSTPARTCAPEDAQVTTGSACQLPKDERTSAKTADHQQDRIRFDDSQSSSWPLSSTICAAPMPSVSSPMPQKSMPRLAAGYTAGRR